MIKNDRQFKITQAEARRFEAALAALKERPPGGWNDVEVAALESQLSTLSEDLAEYEQLTKTELASIVIGQFRDLPEGLIKARIASGLTQQELADRLGLKAQMVQRYEATDYASASFSRLVEVASALDVEITNEITLGGAGLGDADLLRQLRSAGISTALIERRLLPEQPKADSPGATAEVTQRIFGIGSGNFEAANRNWGEEILVAASFKLPSRFNEPQLKSYTMYAFYIAQLVLRGTPSLRRSSSLPTTPSKLREEVMELTGAFTFLSTVDYLWANGVVVLPLADPGAFHGAYWRIDDRDVIILKQSNRSPARWHFDLLHEYYHLLATEDSSRMVLDDDQSELGLADADEEEEANQFAGSALLAGRAEELTAEAVSTAGGRMERLKSAVSSVAQRREIDLAALANYVAWRLSLQGENWWAAASSLQPSAPDPWEVARDSLLLQLDLQGLDDLDRSILIRAIQEVGG